MIPDTFTGGLILSLVNMVVVFLVLIIIGFVINLIYKSVSKSERTELPAETVEASVEPPSMAQTEVAAEKVAFDSLDSRRKAIITAALSAYLGHDEVPVFVRRIPDAGAWGKSSRAFAVK